MGEADTMGTAVRSSQAGAPSRVRGEPKVEAKFAAKRSAWARGPELLSTTHHVHLADARALGMLKNGDVQLVVTSPPYWNLKEYRPHKSQLGHIDDYSLFLEELLKVWRECHRILVPGGRLCIVVGDVCQSRREHGRHQVVPLHADILRVCREVGFETLAPIIWYKIANAATEVAGNGAGFLGKPYEPNAIIKNDIEFILLLRKPGYRQPTDEQRDLSVIEKADHARWFRQIWDDVPGSSLRDHPAPYALEIPRRLISMFSFVGDTVLDPFLGTGTTTAAAISLHRSSVGLEIDPHYFELARRRLSAGELDRQLLRYQIEFHPGRKPLKNAESAPRRRGKRG